MDAFQIGLSRGVPAKVASAYFVGLKRWQTLSSEDDALMAACVKEAASLAGLPSPTGGSQKTASLLEQFRKIAAEESTHHAGELATPTPAEDDAGQAAAYEQEALQAEEQNASSYYQQVLQGLREQLSGMQEHTQGLEQQNQQLTEQQAGHDAALQSAQQETQLAQQAALEQTQNAAAQATQSMQQAVDAENRALQSKAQEAAAKIQQQQVRSQLFDLASQGLLGSEPPVEEGAAAEGLQPTSPSAQPGAEQGAAGDPTGVPAEVGASGTEQAATGEQGAPNAGLNEAGQPANAEGMPGQTASSETAGAAAPPGAVQPSGDSSGGAGAGSGTGPQAPSEGNPQNPTAKRTGQVSIKVGAVGPVTYGDVVAFLEGRHGRPLPKEAGVKSWAADKTAGLAAQAVQALRQPEVAGGLAGGALGLGLGVLEATGHGPDLAKLRAKVEGQEAQMRQPGVRNFMQAFNVVSNRMLLTHGEAVKSHPVLGTLASGAAGAAMGVEAGRELPALLREAKGWHAMGRPPVG